jgi:hypothetical protein
MCKYKKPYRNINQVTKRGMISIEQHIPPKLDQVWFHPPKKGLK